MTPEERAREAARRFAYKSTEIYDAHSHNVRIVAEAIREAVVKLTAERTYYRDMWLAQRVENENFRKQLGLVPVSDEAERELTPRSTTPTDAHSTE
jgi:hypothetical protein